jgi:hypothetical protein
LPPDVFDIHEGQLTVDTELFFSEEDVKNLFDWNKKYFVRICEFASGGYQDSEQYQSN